MRYPRTELAQEIAGRLLGQALFPTDAGGLFLAAPRRTGKSTFLQHDLAPLLADKEVTVAYVDLWADKSADPANLIAWAIARKLNEVQRTVAKVISSVSKVQVKGIEFDLVKVGRTIGATLVEALIELHETAGGPVALIVDEAQYVQTSRRGDEVMSALKSARDQMNLDGTVQLMLIFSGSDRDKLLRLTNTRAAPFYGSDITPMPLLGEDYVRHLAGIVGKNRPDLAPFDNAKLMQAFETFGRRPETMLKAMERALSPFEEETDREGFSDRVLQLAKRHSQDMDESYDSTFHSLTDLQQAIVLHMLDRREKFQPYHKDALESYSAYLQSAVSASQAQHAFNTLRNLEPSIIWKSSRGEYALEDSGMQEWFERNMDNLRKPKPLA